MRQEFREVIEVRDACEYCSVTSPMYPIRFGISTPIMRYGS